MSCLAPLSPPSPIALPAPCSRPHFVSISFYNYSLILNSIFQMIIQKSIRLNCKKRFDQLLASIRKNMSTPALILVLDQSSTKIISSYLSQHQLISFGIMGVQSLQKKRKPYPTVDAVYYISPSQQSIKRVCQDFQQKIQYGAAHILLSSSCSKSLLNLIVNSGSLYSRLRTCKEFNIQFICHLDKHFWFDTQNSYFDAQFNKQEHEKYMSESLRKLLTVACSFPKIYSFQIVYNLSPRKQAQQLANSLFSKLEQLISKGLQKKSANIDKSAKKISVIICQRRMDVIGPLLHDINYHPFFYDLLDVKNDCLKLQKYQNFNLTESDQIFKKYRNTHISKPLSTLHQDLATFSKINQAAKMNVDSKNVDNLNNVMSALPEYSARVKQYNAHLQIGQRMVNAYNQRKIQEVFQLQQSIVTGVDNKKKDINHSKTCAKIVSLLESPDCKLKAEEKARLASIAAGCLNVNEGQVSSMVKSVDKKYMKAIKNTQELMPSEKRNPYYKQSKSQENFQRHLLTIPEFVRSFLRGEMQGGKSRRLNCEQRVAGPSLFKSKLNKQKLSEEVVVFVIGGIGVNQMSRLGSQTFSGGNKIFTPNEYLNQLNTLRY